MHCPSFNIFGTFFPAWMLCALLGAMATALTIRVFMLLKVHDYVRPHSLTYGAVFLNVTLLTWNAWFAH